MSVPSIGFGTAPILGRLDEKQSRRALEHAFTLGVRHFDTARSYGWGECEAVLGSFLRAHPRDSYTLVSKCGIVPVRRSTWLSTAKRVGRQVLRVFPGAHGFVRRAASSAQFQPARTYDVDVLRESVETSLRELRSSYLDVLLLHNFEPDKEGLGEVIDLFRELRRLGYIKRYGFSVEGDLQRGLAYLANYDVLDESVIQAPVSRHLLSLPASFRTSTFIAHSPFRFLGSSSAPGDPSSLSELLQALTGACTCEALVTSMFQEEHISQNLAAQLAARDAVTSAAALGPRAGQ